MQATKDAWDRIHVWLSANAPAGYGHLRPAASVDDIRAAEDAMGLALPVDVVASYKIHDGQELEPGLIGGEGWYLFTLQQMVEERGQLSSVDPPFVPIAWNAMSDYVVIDIGTAGLSIQRHDTDDSDLLAPSFQVWLAAFAGQLENGKLAYDSSEGCLMYTDEID